MIKQKRVVSIQEMAQLAEALYDEMKKDTHHRYLSWEHCYQCFAQARVTRDIPLIEKAYLVDYLSLQLAFYLASWGMYRGSSFLLQKDYRTHIPVVEEILKPEYDVLFGVKCIDLTEKKSTQECLFNLYERLSKFYGDLRRNCSNKTIKADISNTLLTKILLGTLGCTPAYDRFFIEAIRLTGTSTGHFNKKSLLTLAHFYQKNYDSLEKLRLKMKIGELEYPEMKLLDMIFWKIGMENDKASKSTVFKL